MIKNIETLTANEYLKQQMKEGKIPTCLIHAGERINRSPNTLTVKKAYSWEKNRVGVLR